MTWALYLALAALCAAVVIALGYLFGGDGR